MQKRIPFFWHLPVSFRLEQPPARLLHKGEIDGEYEAGKSGKVIPMQVLATKQQHCEARENHQRDHLLHNLELHQRKRAAVSDKAVTVGRYLTRIFGKRKEPAQQDDDVERRAVGDDPNLLELYMTIPRAGHKDVRNDE